MTVPPLSQLQTALEMLRCWSTVSKRTDRGNFSYKVKHDLHIDNKILRIFSEYAIFYQTIQMTYKKVLVLNLT